MFLFTYLQAIKDTGKTTASWEDFKSIVMDCGIAENDVIGATKYLQNLGTIVYFNDEQLKVLSFTKSCGS